MYERDPAGTQVDRVSEAPQLQLQQRPARGGNSEADDLDIDKMRQWAQRPAAPQQIPREVDQQARQVHQERAARPHRIPRREARSPPGLPRRPGRPLRCQPGAGPGQQDHQAVRKPRPSTASAPGQELPSRAAVRSRRSAVQNTGPTRFREAPAQPPASRTRPASAQTMDRVWKASQPAAPRRTAVQAARMPARKQPRPSTWTVRQPDLSRREYHNPRARAANRPSRADPVSGLVQEVLRCPGQDQDRAQQQDGEDDQPGQQATEQPQSA